MQKTRSLREIPTLFAATSAALKREKGEAERRRACAARFLEIELGEAVAGCVLEAMLETEREFSGRGTLALRERMKERLVRVLAASEGSDESCPI